MRRGTELTIADAGVLDPAERRMPLRLDVLPLMCTMPLWSWFPASIAHAVRYVTIEGERH